MVSFTSIGNSTYVPCHKSLQDSVSEHQEVFVNNFSMKRKDVNLCITRLFWILSSIRTCTSIGLLWVPGSVPPNIYQL